MSKTHVILVVLVASLLRPVYAQDEKLGEVSFSTSCAPETRASFDRAVALLHSFWYEAAEAAFLEIAEKDSGCVMAHWGVAMTAVHPLWPGTPNYDQGKRAIARAVALEGGTPKEQGYIDAVAKIFVGTEPADYPARKKAFERAMADLHQRFPSDAEVTIFYALALTATAPPEDKTYTNQKKAAGLLDGLASSLPSHPGILHYTIHAYDSPEMAEHALDAARRYSEIASSVPHGLHMSSHIFTRLGLWKESVATNSAASRAGHRFASELGLAGVWDEELHAMEYWMYALLQLADDETAENVLGELRSHPTASPMSLKSAHPFAGIPARYFLERRQWKAAASLESVPADLPWDRFPFAYAMTVFARAMGSARTMELADARTHVAELESLRDRTNDSYWSRQIEVLRREAAAWLAHAEGTLTPRFVYSSPRSSSKNPWRSTRSRRARCCAPGSSLASFSWRWGDLAKASPLSSRLSPSPRIDSTVSMGPVQRRGTWGTPERRESISPPWWRCAMKRTAAVRSSMRRAAFSKTHVDDSLARCSST